MIDKSKLIDALCEACEKDSFKELPSWIVNVINKQPDEQFDNSLTRQVDKLSGQVDKLQEEVDKLRDEKGQLMRECQNLKNKNIEANVEAQRYFNRLCENGYADKQYNEWLENKPLKFEELEDGMWVWDNMNKEYIQIEWLDIEGESYKYLMAHTVPSNKYQRLYSNNRFYLREAEEDDQ